MRRTAPRKDERPRRQPARTLPANNLARGTQWSATFVRCLAAALTLGRASCFCAKAVPSVGSHPSRTPHSGCTISSYLIENRPMYDQSSPAAMRAPCRRRNARRARLRVLAAVASDQDGAEAKSVAVEPSTSNAPEVALEAPGEMSGLLLQQRVESVKGALLCGAVGAAARLLAVGVGAVLPTFLRDVLATPEPSTSSVLFVLASGFAQGALFGLTYRYVVRSDRKPASDAASRRQMDTSTVGHLGDGCVAAFALTSALGQSEPALTQAASAFVGILGQGEDVAASVVSVILPAVPLLPRVAGDLVLYSAAREAIDRALDEGLIEAFP